NCHPNCEMVDRTSMSCSRSLAMVSSLRIVMPKRGPARLSDLGYGGMPGDGCVAGLVGATASARSGHASAKFDCAQSGAPIPKTTIKQAMRLIRNLLRVTYAAGREESCERR